MTYSSDTRHRSFSKKLFGLLILIVLGAGATGYYYINKPGIVDFTNTTQQHQFVNNLFAKNWYWLISEDTKDFSPDHMMDFRAPSKDPEDKNKLIMKIYNEWGRKPVGFTAYYYPYLGQHKHALLLFLAVDEAYRNKGVGRKLMNYALDDLKAHGCTSVELVTRLHNPAQFLYKSLGFYEIGRDSKFIRFKRLLL